MLVFFFLLEQIPNTRRRFLAAQPVSVYSQTTKSTLFVSTSHPPPQKLSRANPHVRNRPMLEIPGVFLVSRVAQSRFPLTTNPRMKVGQACGLSSALRRKRTSFTDHSV
jgi:hypothetical protein